MSNSPVSNDTRNNVVAQDPFLDDPTLQDPDAPASNDTFPFDDAGFQRELVSIMLTDTEWLGFGASWIRPSYLTEKSHQTILSIAYRYFNKYQKLPTLVSLRNEIKTTVNPKIVAVYLAELECTIGAYAVGMDSREYIRDKMIQFAKTKAAGAAFHRFLEDSKKCKANPGEIGAALAKQLQMIEERMMLEHSTFALGERIDSNRPEWLIKPLMRRNTISVLFGESGSRKTWVALDLALCVATGTPFLGRFPVKRGRVFYVISEGADDFEFRAAAWCKAHGIDPPSIDWLAYRPGHYDFGEPSAVEQLVSHIKERMGGADLIFVDTLAKNFNKDTDTNEGMTVFLNAMESVRDKTGATVVPLHHTGWTNTGRERGGRALRDGCDTSILVEKDADRSLLKCKKQKLGQEFPDVPVLFDLVRLPEFDTADESITALVGRYDDSSDEALPRLITEAFDVQESWTQQELVKWVRNAWKGTPPGRDSLRNQIEGLCGEMLCKDSVAGRYEYRLL